MLILHGVNCINAGDLGIIHATVQRLREEMPRATVAILSPFFGFSAKYLQGYEYRREVDVESWGATEVEDFYSIPLEGTIRKVRFFSVFASLLVTALVDRFLFGFRLSKRHRVLKHYVAADAIISKGGGFLHDKTGSVGIPPHLASMLLALCYEAPLVIYAQSIGPLENTLGRFLTRFVLNHADCILIREQKSLDFVREDLCVDNSKIDLTADEAFLLVAAEDSRIDEILSGHGISADRPIVGFAPCNWGFPDSIDPVASKKKYVEETAITISSLTADFDAQCVIACHVEVDGTRDDRAIAMEVLALIEEDRDVHLLGVLDDVEIKGIWSRCDLFIGTRMHSNIFALAGGVPTIAISYLHKTAGIMEDLGLSDWVVAIDEFTSERAIEMTRRILEEGALTREIVGRRVETMKAVSRQNARKVRDLVSN